MANKNSRWSQYEDELLWKCRDCSVPELAEAFRRTNGSICYRLQNLRNPAHTANQRLMLHCLTLIGQRVIHCTSSHIQSRAQQVTELMNSGSPWRVKDDICIKANRDCSYQALAKHHSRTVGSIRTRMGNLFDPNHSASQRLLNPKKEKKGKEEKEESDSQKGKRWSIEDDNTLWSSRDCSIQKLAAHLRRSDCGIMCRLENLRDPESKPHLRLVQFYGQTIGKRNISCWSPHRISSGSKVIDHEDFDVVADFCVFTNRDCSVSSLAIHLNAQTRVIRDRLCVLMDCNNDARIQLNKYMNSSTGATTKSNHNKKRKRVSSDDDEKKPYAKKRKMDANEVPNELCDPITYKLMNEPMLVTVSGYTYERKTIVACIKEHGRDPFTNQSINMKHLVLNRALKDSIDRWKRKNGK